ncbi:hypothetical protein BACSTE_00191 [Bacteroides stercoris ATCC 43183]|uniref:Uncharacterized protein n=1 Tax=Bacteroides stercoris ATCC 43183 TaxID=449673 RepID=B0NL68_BACSE|nr:hypothetical protein BACSTE_00191 [Bacteroides stercoris ATCC 43183]
MQLFQFRCQNTVLGFKFLTFFVENTNKYTIFVYVKTTYYPHRLLHFETKSS